MSAEPAEDRKPLLVFLNEVAGGRKLLQAVRERQDQVSGVVVAAPQNQPSVGQLIDSDEIREVLDTGGQVLLSSHDDVGGRPLYEDDTIATNHLYWVSGVTDSGDLELTNPWSPGDDPIVLTYEEFQDNFGHISTSRP